MIWLRCLNAVADLLRESFEVVGLVSDGREALIATLKLEPELVVLRYFDAANEWN